MLVLTAVTGLIDAVSYLRMGHVFVANMTGNVVFLGFSLKPGSGLSLPASAVAIGAFLAGALAGGRLAVRLTDRPRTWLRAAFTSQAVILAVVALLGGLGVLSYTGHRAADHHRRARGQLRPAERHRPPHRRGGPDDHGAHDDPHRPGRRQPPRGRLGRAPAPATRFRAGHVRRRRRRRAPAVGHQPHGGHHPRHGPGRHRHHAADHTSRRRAPVATRPEARRTPALPPPGGLCKEKGAPQGDATSVYSGQAEFSMRSTKLTRR
ncbi:DUF1275 domain-containing protein [Amycolatopsis acidiphila]|uniref:DUF1275 domain-containing protein n=1 Tax=Amycolatopsis acidiphila TaxID=715473 RepID=A0A558ALB2_9PSEU|nr:DUF1275 domain-containing protein [Amycolatopsis acidiphila]